VKFSPQLVIFDVDGVLVDVHGSFHRTIIDTVQHFTKHRPTYADIQTWKRRTGYNDDWRLSTDWVKELGGDADYAKVKRQFQKFYWGVNKKGGNVLRERWLVPRRRLERWAKRAELALFTGRTRRELKFTLDRFRVADLFRRVVTMDDVERLKPDPEGIHFLLDGKAPGDALYLGDNLDDALASQSAAVPFVGVLPRGSDARRMRGGQLRSHGARVILDNVNELERYWK
jgi:HAD superfamily phosphatase